MGVIFADDISKRILLDENLCISNLIEVSSQGSSYQKVLFYSGNGVEEAI